jgi:hypothetical protein
LHHEDPAHDKSTDSLTVEIRRLPSVRVPAKAGIDIGEDGEPVGYDIQHASTKKDFIARLILDETQAAAE